MKFNITGNALGLLVICGLMLTKNKYFRFATTTLIALSWPYTALLAAVFKFAGVWQWQGQSLIIYVLYSVIWIAYLNMSRSVRVTYEHMVRGESINASLRNSTRTAPSVATHTANELNVNIPSATPVVSKLMQSQPTNVVPTASNQATDSSTDDFWEQALNEFEGANRNRSLWARCFAEADGNEATAKARYIKTRAIAFIAENESPIKQAELNRLAEVTKEKVYLASVSLSSQKGECPNCKNVISLDSSRCPKCTTVFKFKSDKGVVSCLDIKRLTVQELIARGE